MDNRHRHTFLASTRDINHAAIACLFGRDHGFKVETVRQAAARRAIFYYPDFPELAELIERYERREVLPFPAKDLLSARTQLYHDAARAVREAA